MMTQIAYYCQKYISKVDVEEVKEDHPKQHTVYKTSEEESAVRGSRVEMSVRE